MKKNTRQRILNYSEELMLSMGYNGFSFLDISKKIGIKKASMHYHFPTKEDLAVTIVRKYRNLFIRWKKQNSSKETLGKIESFFSLYHSLYRNGKQICPIGMLLAEYSTIPELLQKEVKGLLEDEKNWILTTLELGLKSNEISKEVQPLLFADLIMSYLSGSIKFWRLNSSDETYYTAKEYFLKKIEK